MVESITSLAYPLPLASWTLFVVGSFVSRITIAKLPSWELLGLDMFLKITPIGNILEVMSFLKVLRWRAIGNNEDGKLGMTNLQHFVSTHPQLLFYMFSVARIFDTHGHLVVTQLPGD